MLQISLAAHNHIDNVILGVFIPLLDPIPPLVNVVKCLLVGDVIRVDDGVSSVVV